MKQNGNKSVSDERRAERRRLDAISKVILDAAFEIHTTLGPGLLESAYAKALFYEMQDRGLHVLEEQPVPATWKGRSIGLGFRADLVVERSVLIELKAVEAVRDVHRAQLRTYLKLLDFRLGLLINFNETLLKNGYSRIVNNF